MHADHACLGRTSSDSASLWEANADRAVPRMPCRGATCPWSPQPRCSAACWRGATRADAVSAAAPCTSRCRAKGTPARPCKTMPALRFSQTSCRAVHGCCGRYQHQHGLQDGGVMVTTQEDDGGACRRSAAALCDARGRGRWQRPGACAHRSSAVNWFFPRARLLMVVCALR